MQTGTFKFSKEARKRMSLAHLGVKLLDRTGEKHYAWKEDKAKYGSKHDWIKYHYGNPKKCEHCEKIGEKVKRAWNIDWANISGNYLRNRSDFKGLCRKCHIAYDRRLKPNN